MLLTLFFFLLSLILRRRQERRADVAGSKNRRANKMARTRLKLAEDYLHKNLSGAYYEELHKALMGYVSDKLLIPAADLSKETIGDKLRERGVRDESIATLTTLIDQCEFARYSPDSGQTQMENEFSEAVQVISDIEGQLNKGKTSRKPAAGAVLVALLIGFSLSAQAQEDVAGLWQKAGDARTMAECAQLLPDDRGREPAKRRPVLQYRQHLFQAG